MIIKGLQMAIFELIEDPSNYYKHPQGIDTG